MIGAAVMSFSASLLAKVSIAMMLADVSSAADEALGQD